MEFNQGFCDMVSCSEPCKRYDLIKLYDSSIEDRYKVEIQNRFAALSHEDTDSWDTFKQEHNAAAEATLGTRPSRRHEWISNDTRQLVEDKRAARLAGNLTEYRELNKRCQKSAWLDKQRWADEKALAGEAALLRGSTRDAFAHFRQLQSACPHISSPILNANGSLISDKVQKAARWREYYEQLLSRPPTHPPVVLAQAAASAPEDTKETVAHQPFLKSPRQLGD